MVHDQSISRPCGVNYAAIGISKIMDDVFRTISFEIGRIAPIADRSIGLACRVWWNWRRMI
jgi:hypothetical protein